MKRSEVGRIGEDLACGYLVNKGYKIISRNYREKFGEIDIVAKSPDKTLVFVEVKTILETNNDVDKSPASYPHLAGLKAYEFSDSDDSFRPEDHMSLTKMSRFRKICQYYANGNSKLIGAEGYGLDVLARVGNRNQWERFFYQTLQKCLTLKWH